jgi:hypothetical protein
MDMQLDADFIEDLDDDIDEAVLTAAAEQGFVPATAPAADNNGLSLAEGNQDAGMVHGGAAATGSANSTPGGLIQPPTEDWIRELYTFVMVIKAHSAFETHAQIDLWKADVAHGRMEKAHFALRVRELIGRESLEAAVRTFAATRRVQHQPHRLSPPHPRRRHQALKLEVGIEAEAGRRRPLRHPPQRPPRPALAETRSRRSPCAACASWKSTRKLCTEAR